MNKKENILEIKKLRLQGFKIKEISNLLNKPESQIKGICSYYGILKPNNSKKKIDNLLLEVNLNEYINPKTFSIKQLQWLRYHKKFSVAKHNTEIILKTYKHLKSISETAKN